MAIESTENELRIGLALSGGGFRATLFHLGVVRCLRDYGLLGSVRRIASVSGGSILAAHLSLNWDDWTSADDNRFQKAQDEVVSITQVDLRNRVLRRLFVAKLYRWASPIKDGTSTSILAWLYNRELYHKGRLRDFKIPVDLLTSNLTVPDADTFFSADGFRSGYPGDPQRNEPAIVSQQIPCDTLAVAAAVAASSAFPGLFKPVRAGNKFLNCGIRDIHPLPQYLSDGGVRDNLGSRHLGDLIRSQSLDLVLLSDAGAEIAWLDTNYTASTWRTLVRCFDVSEASRRSAAPPPDRRMRLLSISNIEPSIGNRLDGSQLRQLAKIRTDLDEFTDFEAWCLMSHGFCVAEANLRDVLKNKQDGAFQPWQAEGVTIPTDITKALDASSRRMAGVQSKLRLLFDRRDWRAFVAWAVLLVAVVFGVCKGAPWACFGIRSVFIWVADHYYPEPMADTFEFSRRAVQAAEIALKHDSIGVLARDTINYAYGGLASKVGGRQELQVFEQTASLGPSRPTKYNLRFTNSTGQDVDVRARDGKAFLVRSGTENTVLNADEVTLPKQPDGMLVGSVDLPRVESDQFLVFLLAVEPKQGGQLPSTFQLRFQ